jgi:acyl-ACP thioesterase
VGLRTTGDTHRGRLGSLTRSLQPVQPPATVTLPPKGRVFRHRDRVTLADVSPAGRARLDALARWLQDAAHDDWRDSGLDDDAGVWIVRRLSLTVHRFPRMLEQIDVATFCSGTAPLWAERSSLVYGDGEVAVEAVALWVHLQRDGARPRRLPAGFDEVYGPSAMGRRPRAALRHPAAPPARAPGRPWHFRGTDLDLAGHVNNAVYWEALEDELVADEPAAGLAAEIEHRAPTGAGEATVRSDGPIRWIADPAGAVVATLTVAPLG